MDDAELDRTLKAALSVSPSPEFAAKVRTAIARTEDPPLLVDWLKPIALGVSLAAVALVIGYRPSPVEKFPSPTTLNSRQLGAIVEPPHVASSTPPMAFSPFGSLKPATPQPKITEVIIAADSRHALMQLLESVHERRFEATFEETPPSTPWAMSELSVAPLTIEPLNTPVSNNN